MSERITGHPTTGVNTKAQRVRLAIALAMFAVWLGIVVFAVCHHEFFRDEVRPLVLALSAEHFWLVPATIRGAEGHPALWYTLLRISHDIVGVNQALPVLSVAIAASSMLLLLTRAPFPLWWTGLFMFSGLPLYEYSVMARNYGIAMLLMFVFCVLMTRPKRPDIGIGIVLFLIAQTNVAAAMLMPFLSLIQIGAWWSDRKSSEYSNPAAIILSTGLAVLGIAAALFTVYPPVNDLVFESQTDNYWHHSYVKTLFAALTQPGHFFRLLTTLSTWPSNCLMFLAALGLIRRPLLFVAAICGLWITALFSALVYEAHYRHLGIYLVFLISLYWIMRRDPMRRPVALGPDLKSLPMFAAFYVVIPVLFALNWSNGIRQISVDYSREMSKSEALGKLIRASPKLRNAIIVAEPDAWAEAMPYYVANDIYSVRANRFDKIAHWSHHEKFDITLNDLLIESSKLHATTGRPVIILTKFPLAPDTIDTPLEGSFGQHFQYSGRELRDFQAATTPLPLGPPAFGEQFDAYLLE